MKHGILENKIEENKGAIIDTFVSNGVKKASLFGSFVNGNANKDSDVDFLVELQSGKSLIELG